MKISFFNRKKLNYYFSCLDDILHYLINFNVLLYHPLIHLMKHYYFWIRLYFYHCYSFFDYIFYDIIRLFAFIYHQACNVYDYFQQFEAFYIYLYIKQMFLYFLNYFNLIMSYLMGQNYFRFMAYQYHNIAFIF